MVNRDAKNRYKIVKKDHINVACELSSNSGHLSHKAFIFGLCGPFSFVRDVNMMLRI